MGEIVLVHLLHDLLDRQHSPIRMPALPSPLACGQVIKAVQGSLPQLSVAVQKVVNLIGFVVVFLNKRFEINDIQQRPARGDDCAQIRQVHLLAITKMACNLYE